MVCITQSLYICHTKYLLMKKKEVKKQYAYRAKPSIVNKARKKAVKENKTLSEKVENLLENYIAPETQAHDTP